MTQKVSSHQNTIDVSVDLIFSSHRLLKEEAGAFCPSAPPDNAKTNLDDRSTTELLTWVAPMTPGGRSDRILPLKPHGNLLEYSYFSWPASIHAESFRGSIRLKRHPNTSSLYLYYVHLKTLENSPLNFTWAFLRVSKIKFEVGQSLRGRLIEVCRCVVTDPNPSKNSLKWPQTANSHKLSY